MGWRYGICRQPCHRLQVRVTKLVYWARMVAFLTFRHLPICIFEALPLHFFHRQVPRSPQCNCTSSFLRSPTDECYVGDIDHIRDRFRHQVSETNQSYKRRRFCPDIPLFSRTPITEPLSPLFAAPQVNLPEYRKFLEFMCPGSNSLPQFPAAGSDPVSCPRAVLGTYDDHDSGWNNGNSRLVRTHFTHHAILCCDVDPSEV